MPSALIWGATALLFLVGMAGTVLPGLPGIGLIFIGILLYAAATGFQAMSATSVVIFGVVALVALAADYIGSVMGAKLGGGGKSAVVGTLFGAIIGMIALSPVGLVIGAYIGAFVGALADGNAHNKALKVALFSVLGVLGATVVQFVLGISMIVAFLIGIVV